MSKLRLDKFLADQGLASRKELREIVRSGRVRVNGSAVQNADQKVDPEVDQICFDGRSLSASSERTLMLYKPLGVVSATEDRKDGAGPAPAGIPPDGSFTGGQAG